MTETQIKAPVFRAISPAKDPAIEYDAALYFLDGQYLFRSKERSGWSAKFVTAADVQAAFTGKEQDSGWLPAGVVRAGSNAKGKWFVYSTPAQKVTIYFDSEEQGIRIPLPRTLLLGVGNEYYLWVLTNEHFDPRSSVYAAPFPNVHDTGRVCWGATTPPRADPEKARSVWALFFETPFNNHLIDRKSKAFPDDVRNQLRALDGSRKYPTEDLVPVGTSASYRIEQLLKG